MAIQHKMVMINSDHHTKHCCSVVIPTKNGGKLFLRLLDGLIKQSLWNSIELIVIDSGSTDGTPEAARKIGARVLNIAPVDFNHGSTRDYAISQSSCEIVVLMVQDAVPYDSTLIESILKRFDDPDVAGVYARQIPQNDADLLTKRNLNNWLTGRLTPEIRSMKSYEWYAAMPPIEKYLFCNFDNVCSAIRKTVWNNYTFGEINFGEDIDWAERVLKSGAKIVYEPAAAVIHSHDRSIYYEYKRTYVCHRKLYQQFRLHLVPSIKSMFRSWIHSCFQDFKYINAQSVPASSKIFLWIKTPALNFLSALAQYRAVKDELSGRPIKIQGV